MTGIKAPLERPVCPATSTHTPQTGIATEAPLPRRDVTNLNSCIRLGKGKTGREVEAGETLEKSGVNFLLSLASPLPHPPLPLLPSPYLLGCKGLYKVLLFPYINNVLKSFRQRRDSNLQPSGCEPD